MSNDKKRHRKGDEIVAFVDRLLGDVEAQSDADIDALFADLCPNVDASAAMHALVESAAGEFRRQQQLPPPHIQAALDASKAEQQGTGTKPGWLHDLIERALAPSLEPAHEIGLAYHHKGELTEKDKAILDGLAAELRDDWNKPK